VHTRLHPDGAVTHGLLSGLTLTTHPEALPGFGAGEAYEPMPDAGVAVAVA
jgi:hypothetical protein